MAQDQIAVSGQAHYKGIPAATVTWGTPGNQVQASATTYTATLFTSLSKALDADTSESRDNDNEVVALHRSNKRTRYTFSAKVTGATRAACLLAAENIPQKFDAIKIVRDDAGDSSGTDTIAAWVESAEVAYSPDGEAAISFTAVEFPNTLAAAT